MRGGNFSCSLAFTLAETLITLGIIGVVAALTIPNLIHTYQEKAVIANLKKTYSVLTQGFKQAIDEYGSVDTWCTTEEKETLACSYKIYDMLSHYIKGSVIKTDYNVTDYKRRDGSKHPFYVSSDINSATSHFNTKPFVLHDGTYIWIKMNGGEGGCYAEISEKTTKCWGGTCGWITVDLNGSNSKPNTDGIDVFGFTIFTDGIAPQGTRYDNYWYPF